MKFSRYTKSIVSVLLLALAGFRFWRYGTLKDRMDGPFFSLVMAAFLLWLIPWEQLKSFKAGGVEISLQQPEVKAAMSGLGLDRIDDEQLRSRLLQMGSDLQSVRGSRVLWIDDKPYPLLGGRRLLRALGAMISIPISKIFP